jgi:Domain of unknown function (DUF1707)
MQIDPSLRASDADREQVAELLRQATAEGRLGEDELEERLDALYAARTYGVLHALIIDIPVGRSPGDQSRVRLRRLISAVSAVTLVVAVFGLLAVVRTHAAGAVLRTGRHLSLPGPLAVQRHGLIVGFLLCVGLFVVSLTCAALVWALMDSRSQRHLRISGPSERR